ncbi:hypothetical protein BDN71DRAFT_1427350 [Pleurotus eryngii]|uniref:DUF7918 domain-containing protein n=1 Tax=Pleurotus eryngii TaxID=5323 RepID=A0A9P6DJG8_PLEER|nr:hypothetical protein BDN71DRAFT_1427350 [Pleurotus eryngii]
MLTHRGFSAWIACEGQALPEYLVAVEEEVHQVSCWIPSEEGKSFAVFWRDNTDPAPAPEHPAQPIDSCGFITLDGLVVPGRFLFGTGTASRAGVRSGPNTEKPFVFLKVGEEEEGGGGGVDAFSSSKSRKDLGTIILRIRRVLRVEKCPANPIKAVPSKVLGKRKTGDVGIGFGDDVPAYYQSPVTWEVQPYPEDAHLGAASYVTFVFRYRSAEFLESQGIMPSPRAQPHPLASAAGSSHYRTGSSANATNDKVQAKDKGKGSKGKAKETGLETPAMTPLPFPMRSLPPPPPTAQQQSSGVLPIYPPTYPPHYPPVYPPHPEVQPQQSQQQVGTTLVEAPAGSAEALTTPMTTPAPNPDVYPPMTPTPSATPANDNATTGNATATLENGDGNGGVGPAAMRRIVSAPIGPTQHQQLRLQEQQLQEERELEEERDHEHESERESELQHGQQRREASSAGAGVSPPRKRLKQSDFLANGPYRMRRPSDMKRSMSWRAPNSKPLSSLSASTSASVTSTSVTSTSTTSPSNAASASTASASETAPVNDRVGITFNNPFTSAPLIRSISNPHPHPQLNPRAQLNPQSQAQSRSFADAYADAVGLGPTQLPPYSQPEPNNHPQPHTQQPQTLAQATHYRSQQQTLAQARAQYRHLPYRRPSINTTRALQQKRQQRQMQASTLPPPPTSSSPFSSSPETPVTEEFGRGGEASIDASPVLGSGGVSGGGIGGGGGGDAEGGDGDGCVEAKRRGSRRVVYEDLGDIGPRDFGLDDVGGESDGGGGGSNSASSSQESALGLGLGLGMAMGNGPGLSSFEGDQYGGYNFTGFGGFGGFGGADSGGGEDIGGGAGVGVGGAGAGDGGMGTALELEGADPYGGFFQSGY